jgi:hypothetical protein
LAAFTWVMVSVVSSPLTARIAGGSRMIWVDPTAPAVLLDARGSVDPDNAPASLLASWSCTRQVSAVACFNASVTSTLATPTEALMLRLPNQLFSAASAEDPYVFQVTVSKDVRTAASDGVVLTASFLPLPAISISVTVPTQGPVWTKINAVDKVALSALITAVNGLPVAAYTILWSCPSNNLDMSPTSAALNTPPSSPTLVIASGSLQGGATYTFRLTLTNLLNAAAQTQSSVTLAVNQVPLGGTCAVTPEQGVALMDTFQFACRDWDDAAEDLPLQYSFAVWNPATAKPVSILRDFQATSSASAFLPAGAPVVIRVQIQDRFGALTSVLLSVNVSTFVAPTAAQVSVLASTALDRMALAQQAGDLSAASQVVGPMVQALASASASASASGSESQADKDSRAAIRESLLTSMLTTVSNTGTALTGSALTQSMMMASAIVNAPAELTPAVRDAAMAFASEQAAQSVATRCVCAIFRWRRMIECVICRVC